MLHAKRILIYRLRRCKRLPCKTRQLRLTKPVPASPHSVFNTVLTGGCTVEQCTTRVPKLKRGPTALGSKNKMFVYSYYAIKYSCLIDFCVFSMTIQSFEAYIITDIF